MARPIWSRVAGLRGRTWRDCDGRSKISSWYSRNDFWPFGLNHLTAMQFEEVRFCVLVEGEMDCLSVWLAGLPCVASSKSSIGRYQAEQLAGKVDTCLIWPDADAAGAKGAETSANLLTSLGVGVKLLDPTVFPDAKDANDALREYGPSTILYEVERVILGT